MLLARRAGDVVLTGGWINGRPFAPRMGGFEPTDRVVNGRAVYKAHNNDNRFLFFAQHVERGSSWWVTDRPQDVDEGRGALDRGWRAVSAFQLMRDCVAAAKGSRHSKGPGRRA